MSYIVDKTELMDLNLPTSIPGLAQRVAIPTTHLVGHGLHQAPQEMWEITRTKYDTPSDEQDLALNATAATTMMMALYTFTDQRGLIGVRSQDYRALHMRASDAEVIDAVNRSRGDDADPLEWILARGWLKKPLAIIDDDLQGIVLRWDTDVLRVGTLVTPTATRQPPRPLSLIEAYAHLDDPWLVDVLEGYADDSDVWSQLMMVGHLLRYPTPEDSEGALTVLNALDGMDASSPSALYTWASRLEDQARKHLLKMAWISLSDLDESLEAWAHGDAASPPDWQLTVRAREELSVALDALVLLGRVRPIPELDRLLERRDVLDQQARARLGADDRGAISDAVRESDALLRGGVVEPDWWNTMVLPALAPHEGV